MIHCIKHCLSSPRWLLLLSAVVAGSLLAVAFIGQYGFNLHPCDLCIYQRVPYALIVVVGIVGFFLKSIRLQFWAAVLCALLFLTDAGIAGYHTGVELDIFKGPDACSASSGGEKTLEQMRAEIMGAPLVTCAQAMAYFLGLSMAAWNFIAASACFIGLSFLLYRARR